ncbi:MAG: ATP-binding protein [Acidobacteriota bacterium]
MTREILNGWRLAAGLAGVATVTWLFAAWLPGVNAATVSAAFLMVVLVVAANSRLVVAAATSVAAALAFNYFFLPPVGTLTVADPENWVALISFLAVSLVAANLSAVARAQTDEATARRDELARLFDLSRDVLVVTDSRGVLAALARSVARRFDLDYVGLALPRLGEWEVIDAGATTLGLDPAALAVALAAAQTTLEFDAYARTYAGHRTIDIDGRVVRLVPLRVGTRPIGLLATAGRAVEAGTLDTLAGLVAIAIERAQFLDERKAAELTRQSEALKTTLLASIGHDLRTPLTAIRVAATNLRMTPLGEIERLEQTTLIETEVERLSRLFQNILEMARLDAGAVLHEWRRAHPSEIVEAARDQAGCALAGHRVEVSIDPDLPLQLDPRLTASALAHLLENAAHYAPAGSAIEVRGGTTDDALTIAVRDHGPGIPLAELPHLFERFYRGDAAQARASGTGMGLWIARGLLAVEGGRVWAENCADGGARFTISVPDKSRVAAPEPLRP